jgi:hypothetical protein
MGAMNEFVQSTIVVVGDLSLPVKVAWAVWLCWACGQLVWFVASNRRPAEPVWTRASVARKSAVRRPVAHQTAAKAAAFSPYGTSDFLAALEEEQSARKFNRA